LIFISELRNI